MPDDETKTEETKEEEKETETEDESKEESTELSEKEKKAISESRKYQNRAQKAELALKKIQDEKLSEDEKKDLKIKKLEDGKLESDRQLKESKIDTIIMKYANSLGFKDIDIVKLLVKQELVQDEDVSDVDIKAMIDSIAKEKSYLLGGSETTDVGKGNFEGGKRVEGKKTADELLLEELQNKANF